MKFSQEQLAFIAKHFKRVGDVCAVRDGIVEYADPVWWRAEDGPVLVAGDQSTHWNNMIEFWDLYQIDEPKYEYRQIVYLD